MSETYRALVGEWRKASSETRALQQQIKRTFDAHLAGTGEPPSAGEIDRLHQLRRVEQDKLDVAMRYIESSALGPSTPFKEP